MTYAKNSKIEAADFNDTIVGTSTTTTTNLLNSVWAVGSGNKGYGQTAVPQVSANTTIGFSDWANVVNKTTSMAYHQATAITAVTVPASGARIDYNANIKTNIATVYASSGNANSQGTTSTTTTSSGVTWSNQLLFTHTVSFANGNAARYFFNSGGQLAINFSSPSGTGINSLMNSLGTACGTIVISSLGGAGTITVAGTSYTGVTKIGGTNSGSPAPSVNSQYGYYLQSTSNVEIFRQYAAGSPAGYVSSYISVTSKSAGINVSGNGDTGNVLTFYTLWDEVPNGLVVSAGTSTALTVRYPSSTYLANTWGTVSVTGGVTGS